MSSEAIWTRGFRRATVKESFFNFLFRERRIQALIHLFYICSRDVAGYLANTVRCWVKSGEQLCMLVDNNVFDIFLVSCKAIAISLDPIDRVSLFPGGGCLVKVSRVTVTSRQSIIS